MMHLPVKAHYATLAMLALAQNFESGKLQPARQISRDQEIPSQFLGQILQQLRAARLIESTRGPHGGFMLVREPESISLADIIDAVCPMSESSSASAGANETSLCQVVSDVWDEIRARQREMLESLTLAELCQRAVDRSPMFYI